MSTNKSVMFEHDEHHKPPSQREITLELDPYAAPAEYYGKSHASRKVAKSRTLPAVGHHPRILIDII